MPTPESIKSLYISKYYDSNDTETGYSDYASLAQARMLTFRRYAASIAKKHPQGRVLDIGCAKGYFLLAAEEKNLNAEGIDISQSIIAEIKPFFGKRVLCCSAEALATERPAAYDALFLSDILEHVSDPKSFISSLAVLLRPGGTLLCITPNERGLLARISGRRWVSLKIPEHVILYNYRTLHDLLDDKFEVEFIRPALQEYPCRLIIQRLEKINYFLGLIGRIVGLIAHDKPFRIPDGNMVALCRRRSSSDSKCPSL